jgi:hypothetical protein
MKSVRSRIATFAAAVVLSFAFISPASATLQDDEEVAFNGNCGSYTGLQYRACGYNHFALAHANYEAAGLGETYSAFVIIFSSNYCLGDPAACNAWWTEYGEQVDLWGYVNERLAEFTDP